MGRELRRKEAKRTGKNVKEAQIKSKDKPITAKSFVIIMCVLILLFSLTYILAGIFATKDIKWFSKKTDSEEEKVVSNISNKILASDSLKQLEENYYVYYYDTTNEDDDVTSAVNNLSGIIYRVDLHDDFNTNYVGEPSGVVDSLENLKVSDPTLIKVSSEKIVAFYTGDQIKTLSE